MFNKTSPALLVGALSLLLTACSTSFDRDRYVEAQVLSVERAPERCDTRAESNAAPIVAGIIIGGLIGNQFGKGTGRKVATVAGAGAGAAIADGATRDDGYLRCKDQGYVATVRYIHPHSGKHVVEKISLREHTHADTLLVPVN